MKASDFLENYDEFVSGVDLLPGKILLVGDFNMHYDMPFKSDVSRFAIILTSAGLAQYYHSSIRRVTGQLPPGQVPPDNYPQTTPPWTSTPRTIPTQIIPTPDSSHPGKLPPGQFPTRTTPHRTITPRTIGPQIIVSREHPIGTIL